jgi:pre-60S factor REI1
MALNGGAEFYCSTSGTTFRDKDALTEHYKSDLHRYNLKRKVAGVGL